VGLLPGTRGLVAQGLQFGARKFRVLELQLLQANGVGRRLCEPVGQVRKPDLEGVDVPGRDLHAGIMPLCLSRASTFGSRPRKARNESAAGRLPPTARISSRNLLPAAGLSTPCSSNRLYASADSTSAHL